MNDERGYGRSAELYDAIYGFKDYAAESQRVAQLIQERRAGARTLLDVACGTGKHLEHLRDHYDVEGLDASAEMLAVAARRLPGVPLHRADMFADWSLGRAFDAVTCLFSAIGFARTLPELRDAIANMARHLAAGGVLVVEPWIERDTYQPGGVHNLVVDEADLKISRMNISELEDDVAVLVFHYLVGTPARIEYFTERHELGLFTRDEYEEAFLAAGLEVEHDPEGLIGRGLFIGRAPSAAQAASGSR